jgi:nickel-dependent lactate racemase
MKPNKIKPAELRQTLLSTCEAFQRQQTLRKVLLVPPDGSRTESFGGTITEILYGIFTQEGVHVDILPALGTHSPMNRRELETFFGKKIPPERFLVHRWRDGVTKIGEIPEGTVNKLTQGLYSEPIPVELSHYILDPSYDLILSVGQVVPHEVAGFANYTKNIVIGCGGRAFINASHMIGAAYGIEKTLGKTDTPVRRLFDYAEKNFIKKLPVSYILTVTERGDLRGLFIGKDRFPFEQAAALSAKCNITYVNSPIKNCVVNLDKHIRSTWLGNKAIYRTRLALADGGNLLILAPFITNFGEDAENDRIIRKYGYTGRERILRLCKTEGDLQNNLSAAAHLIHGSADGRFTVTYAAPLLGKKAVESVGYQYMEWDEAVNQRNTESVYYIENPALGLWIHKGS